jgi:hypothetical protein
LSERGRTLPRLGDPKTVLVLSLLILLALAFYAEAAPEPPTEQLKTSPGAKAGVLLGQGKAIIGPDGKDAPSPQEECPDANPVLEDVATGDLETDLFDTHSDRFIISYEILELQPGSGLLTLNAAVEDENGRSISSGKIPSPQPGDPVRIDLTPNMGRTIVDTAPGSYRLEISPSKSDRRYAVLVEECGVPEVS